MDEMNPEIEKLFQAKAERRRQLAALPWPEKVRILIQMQRMIVPLIKDRDPRARVWEIPDLDDQNVDLKFDERSSGPQA